MNRCLQLLRSAKSVLDLNRINLIKISKEYGLKERSAAFQKLPEYLILNFRAAYSFNFDENYNLEFYIRLDNLFDWFYYTQFGLPEAGTQYFFGINFSL